MFDELQSGFLESHRVGRLATAEATGRPHVVPVCYAVGMGNVYITIDEKPKTGRPLKRIRNIEENPAVALVVDRYDENWERLGWVMVRGDADILEDGTEHDRAQEILRDRYPQLRDMSLQGLPVIAIRVAQVTSWGNLEPGA